MRRMKLGVVAVICSGLTLLVGMVAFRPDVLPVQPTGSEEQIRQSLEVCGRLDVRAAKAECYEKRFTLAAEGGFMKSFTGIVEEIERAQPLITDTCHVGAHRAGNRYGSMNDPVSSLNFALETVAICDQGFVHGVLEGVGTQPVTADTYAKLVSICGQVDRDNRNASCVHALGHSAWVHHRDVTAATGICMLFEDSLHQGKCIRGVLMAMNSLDNNEGVSVLDPTERDEICAKVRRLPGAGELHVHSCYGAVTLRLVGDITDRTNEIRALRPAEGWAEGSDGELNVIALWGPVLKACESWGEYASTCHRAVVLQFQLLLPEDVQICRKLTLSSPLRRSDDCTGPLEAVELNPTAAGR